MICPKCKRETSQDDIVCVYCGEVLKGRLIKCPKCNKVLKDTDTICPRCGYQLTKKK